MLLTRPDSLEAGQHELLDELTAACPEMTRLVSGMGYFALLLRPHAGSPGALTRWVVQVRTGDLPRLYAFARG
ncbi:ISL3 family transposase, partial [Streptomyces sp. NPDC090499]